MGGFERQGHRAAKSDTDTPAVRFTLPGRYARITNSPTMAHADSRSAFRGGEVERASSNWGFRLQVQVVMA